jgi:uncharacterized protein (DUF302 family)
MEGVMSTSVMSSTGLHRLIDGTYATIYEEICTALRAADFEIVAEIDMAELLEKKSLSYVRPFNTILVFDSDIAHRVLTVAPTVSTLLPCQITVLETEDAQIEVKITDPHSMWNTSASPYLAPIVEEFYTRLGRAIDAVKR